MAPGVGPVISTKRTFTVKVEEEVTRAVQIPPGARGTGCAASMSEVGDKHFRTATERRECVKSFTVVQRAACDTLQKAFSLGVHAEVDLLMASLRAGARDIAVQQEAFGDLLNLCMKGDAYHCTIVSSGGIRAVVMSMRSHLADAAVQKQACLVLDFFIARNFDNQAKVASAGGLDAIVAGMQAHADDSSVQEWALVALASATAANKRNQSAALSARGCHAVKAAIAAHPTSSKIQHWSKVVLEQLKR